MSHAVYPRARDYTILAIARRHPLLAQRLFVVVRRLHLEAH